MTIANPTLARNALIVDATLSAAAGVAMAAGSAFIAPLTALPQQLLLWAGLGLLPWAAFLYWAARNASGSSSVMTEVILINTVWVIASFGIMAGAMVSPNLLGVAFVTVQALAVAAITVVQFASLRATPTNA